jgi:AcrR family transcriptional regulator
MSLPVSEHHQESRPPGRRERRKADTRQRLLDAALASFAQVGYHASTFDDIANAADVSRATAFNYFPRKEDLIIGLAEDRRAAVASILHADLERDVPTPTVLHDMLRHLAEWYEADCATNQALVRCTLQAGSALIPGWFGSAELLARAISIGQDRGNVRPHVDPDRAGALILDGYLGVLYRWACDELPPNMLATELAGMLDIVLGGLVNAKRR